MEEKPESVALLKKRSDVTDYCLIIMRRGSVVAQKKKWRKAAWFFALFRNSTVGKQLQVLSRGKFMSTWNKMECEVCHEYVTLCVFKWGGAGRRENNTENKLGITINNGSGFKSSVTLLDFYSSRTIVFWEISIRVTSNKFINPRKLIAKIMWKINLKFSLTSI